MSNDPSSAVAAFAAAISKRDAEAAKGLCVDDAFAHAHGDSPGRLFRRATHEKRGFSVAPLALADGSNDQRAAVQLQLNLPARTTTDLHALLVKTPQSWAIGGMVSEPFHIQAFLTGQLPAILDFTALPLDPDAGDAIVAICGLAAQAKAGMQVAADMITELMNETEGAAKVIPWLQHQIAMGLRVRVNDARKLEALNRSVVKVDTFAEQPADWPDYVYLYARSGPPIQWYAQSSVFTTSKLKD